MGGDPGSIGRYYLFWRFYDPEIGCLLSPDRVPGHPTVPQSFNRYLYAVNNPLRYVDPTGEDRWNPFEWVGAAANVVGQALSNINPLDARDMAMNVLGFIPELDVVSDAYFLGRPGDRGLALCRLSSGRRRLLR